MRYRRRVRRAGRRSYSRSRRRGMAGRRRTTARRIGWRM